MDIKSPIVSAEWLYQNLEASKLVILDASMNKVTDSNALNDTKQIPNARFFDIKNKFSNVAAPFPNTVPSSEQFSQEAQKLGINKDSAIIVYDDKGIYSSARAWWLFKAFGFKNIAVLDGGLPEWVNKGFQVEGKQDFIEKTGDFIAGYHPEFF